VRRIDVAKVGGKDIEVWDSPYGMMLRPVEAGVTVAAPVHVPAMVEEVGSLQQQMHEVQDEVRGAIEAAGGRLTAKDFVDRFGGRSLSSGRTIADFLSGVPKDTIFDSVSAIMAAASAEVGRTLDTAGYAESTIAGAVGLSTGGAAGQIDTGSAKYVPKDARDVLVEAGIGNIAALAAAEPTKIVAILQEKGIEASFEDVSKWTGTSMVMVQMGGRGRVR